MSQEPTNKHDLNLWQKLAAISLTIGHIEKTGRNSHFNYAFMEHAQVVAVIRPILDEYGVTVDLEALDATYSEKNRVLLHMSYTVTNADKPSETFTRRWVSEAMDQQDKGINKALTAAEKNVFAKLFHISDQDLEDDANDAQPVKKGNQTPRQQPTTATTSRPATQNQPAPATRPAPAQTAPQRPVTPLPSIVQPIPVAKEYRVEDDTNFKTYSAKIHAAKTLRELSDLGPVIRKQVVDGTVVAALRGEYSKRENILLDIANAQVEAAVGSLK